LFILKTDAKKFTSTNKKTLHLIFKVNETKQINCTVIQDNGGKRRHITIQDRIKKRHVENVVFISLSIIIQPTCCHFSYSITASQLCFKQMWDFLSQRQLIWYANIPVIDWRGGNQWSNHWMSSQLDWHASRRANITDCWLCGVGV